MTSSAFDRWTGPVLAATIAAIGLASLALIERDVLPDWRGGVAAAEIEARFDDALVIREGSISAWSALRYALFGEAAPGAVAGRDGWLFTDEEFVATPGFAHRLDARLAEIVEIERALADEGVTLIVALLPDKARVMADRHDVTRAPAVEARYDTALTRLADAGIAVVDLRDVLAALDAPFLRTDTHWSPAGARAVAAHLAPALVAAGAPNRASEIVAGAQAPYEGDLMRYVRTGPFQSLTGPVPEAMAQVSLDLPPSEGGGGLGLFGDAPEPAVLIGTSYSARTEFGFADFLAFEAQTDIVNLAREGEGPFAPMRAWRDGTPTPPPVVLWEIPERYLTLK